jgi:hypothetical protein
VAKWGLPEAEQTLLTGTVAEAPEALDSGHEVVVVVAGIVVVGAAMVVVVGCPSAVVGALEAALLHAAARSAVAVTATAPRIRPRPIPEV